MNVINVVLHFAPCFADDKKKRAAIKKASKRIARNIKSYCGFAVDIYPGDPYELFTHTEGNPEFGAFIDASVMQLEEPPGLEESQLKVVAGMLGDWLREFMPEHEVVVQLTVHYTGAYVCRC